MKFKNKAERNKDVVTLSSFLFKDKKLVTDRTPGMSYDEYHSLRKHQSQVLKALFKSAPNKNIQSAMPNSIGRINKGSVRKVNTPRKAS